MNLEGIQQEINAIVTGRADQIRAFLGKLDTFTDELNQQRDDITRAIDSTNRLLAYVGGRSEVLNRVLTDLPPLIKHFADKQELLINASDAVGRLSQSADQYLSAARGDLHQDLQALQCPLKELRRAAPYLVGALKLILTQPFDVDTVPQLVRGDYMNLSLTLDLTYSAIDNAFLTGTGFSGALRALEQSFGRDPETMIPDIRYTPNPNDAPGGPLVEREIASADSLHPTPVDPFAIVSVVAIVVLGWYYLRIPSLVGIGQYTLKADLPASGGLYPTANVTYRGITIGKVTAVEPTDQGAQ